MTHRLSHNYPLQRYTQILWLHRRFLHWYWIMQMTVTALKMTSTLQSSSQIGRLCFTTMTDSHWQCICFGAYFFKWIYFYNSLIWMFLGLNRWHFWSKVIGPRTSVEVYFPSCLPLMHVATTPNFVQETEFMNSLTLFQLEAASGKHNHYDNKAQLCWVVLFRNKIMAVEVW